MRDWSDILDEYSEKFPLSNSFEKEFLLHKDYREQSVLWDLVNEERESKKEKQRVLREEKAKKRMARFDIVVFLRQISENNNEIIKSPEEKIPEDKIMFDYLRNIEIYKDTKTSIDKWLRRFEAAITLSKVTNENEKKTTLLFFLEDDAADFVENIEEYPFADICRKLRERFNSQKSARSAKAKLCTFKLDLKHHGNVENRLLELIKLMKNSMLLSDEKKIDFEQQ